MMVRALIGITVLVFELLLRKNAYAKHQIPDLFVASDVFLRSARPKAGTA